MLKIENFIDGEFVAATSGKYLENFDPAVGEVYSLIPDSDEKDVNNAVAAAERAFPAWAQTDAETRCDLLLRLAALIERDAEKLAHAESADNGKPVALARRMDIPRAVANFKFYATAAIHFASEAHETGREAINYTLRKPLGAVACISPWNLPLYLLTWKIAPALAAGNCVVAKPSEITPMTAYLLSKLAAEAGFPPGVLNIVHGSGASAGANLVAHERIKAVSFTGGTKTGRDIARVAAPMFKKLSLELGGKNPNIIFADCDYNEALQTTVRSSFANQGQICLCGSRIFVERSIYQQFLTDFVALTKKLKIGDPLDETVDVGAVVSREHRDKVLSYIDLAESENGKILSGGRAAKVSGRCANGYFIEPTIMENLAFDCRTNTEEIFGAVVSIMPFDSESEVLRFANATEYGLSATVWTENLSRAHRVAEALESGIVWVNSWLLRDLRTPFGGVKNSGVGREGGFEALRFFTEEKNVCIRKSDR